MILQEGDVAVVDVLSDTLDAETLRGLSGQVVCDLRHVRILDSNSLAALLTLLKELHATGGNLKLCGLSCPVRGMVERVHLHRVIEIYATREAAIESYEQIGQDGPGAAPRPAWPRGRRARTSHA